MGRHSTRLWGLAGWAGFYAGQALTQSAARETEREKKEDYRGVGFFSKVREAGGERIEGERDIRRQNNAYSKREGWRERGDEREGEGERESDSK